MCQNYILVGQTPVPEPDLLKWAAWFHNADRIVAQTEVPGGLVSTVFLGTDHRFFGNGPPLLFETMVFLDAESADQYRCCTWREAEEQHAKIVDVYIAG